MLKVLLCREAQSALEARLLTHLDARFDALERTVDGSSRMPSRGILPPQDPLLEPRAVAAPLQESATEIATIQNQLAQILARLETSPVPAPPGSPAPDAHPRPERQEAEEASWNVLEGALARGRWTEEDARLLASSFDNMNERQRLAVLEVLIPALNRGEIELKGGHTLF